jgi:cytochrome c
LNWTLRTLGLALLLALAACQPEPAQAPAPEPAPWPAPDAAVAEKLRALPAPYAEADYASGRRAFLQCAACHLTASGGPPRVGPHLEGLFGRPVGAVEGFAYSPALKEAAFAWDAQRLDAWLAGPRSFLPGNRMAFAGVPDPDVRRDLIAYLMVDTAAN